MENIFGERLAELRKFRDMTQSDLSKELNVTVATISNYENGHKRPSDEIKVKIAKIFNVSLDYLLGVTRIEYKLDRRDVMSVPSELHDEDRNDVAQYVDFLIYKRNKARSSQS